MVTVQQMRAAWQKRAAERDASEAAEADRLRRLMPTVTARLKALGATEVYMFGSLAEGRFRSDSDVDLATRGLEFRPALRASAVCAEILGRAVDLVRLEDAAPTLIERVENTGSRLG